MRALIIFGFVYLAMIATSFWEAYAEGKNSWGKGKLGWKIYSKDKKKIIFDAYHFWLFLIMFPALLAIPLFLNFSWSLFGILLSAYTFGLVVEDFFWFVFNPTFKLKNWGSKHVDWFVWIGFKKCKLPIFYLIAIGVAILSWIFLWGNFALIV